MKYEGRGLMSVTQEVTKIQIGRLEGGGMEMDQVLYPPEVTGFIGLEEMEAR